MRPDVLKAIAELKKYSNRECFADSENGMMAWVAVQDLLRTLGVRP